MSSESYLVSLSHQESGWVISTELSRRVQKGASLEESMFQDYLHGPGQGHGITSRQSPSKNVCNTGNDKLTYDTKYVKFNKDMSCFVNSNLTHLLDQQRQRSQQSWLCSIWHFDVSGLVDLLLLCKLLLFQGELGFNKKSITEITVQVRWFVNQSCKCK